MYLNEERDLEIKIPAVGSWPAAVHEFDADSIWAVNAALASRRPLLLRGEPGTGKSQIARAVAAALGRVSLSYVVNARTESRDLQFSYDALARLAEAQTAAMVTTTQAERKQVLGDLRPGRFLEPGVLWWAFDWTSAEKQFENCHSRSQMPPIPKGASVENGTVVLIDEIDKADADVPNGLLETLGNGGFSVPYTNQAVNADEPFPLIVITTNEERELPTAFLRRCLVHHLKLPEEKKAFMDLLCRRGKLRFGRKLTKFIYQQAAEMLFEDRSRALEDQLAAPGQAEYFDMLEALVGLKKAGQDPKNALEKIQTYIFKKRHHEDEML